MDTSLIPQRYADFTTVTCLNWTPLLNKDCFKEIITDSLYFLSDEKRAIIYAFVIMSTHFHIVWQVTGTRQPHTVRRDFLKFTAQQILRTLAEQSPHYLNDLLVNARDRKFQVWERNSLSIPLWSAAVINQKIEYIHNNPVEAGLCKNPWDYHYSSAGFYFQNDTHWKFLVHVDG